MRDFGGWLIEKLTPLDYTTPAPRRSRAKRLLIGLVMNRPNRTRGKLWLEIATLAIWIAACIAGVIYVARVGF
jgi:hypothetical protein